MSMPRYCSIVLMVSAGPPIAYAALILSRPWPGMSTTVSRGIESFALCPPPERRSMMLSERLRPPTPPPRPGGAGRGGAGRAAVGAEDERRLRARQSDAAAGELVLGGVRHGVLLEGRADQEQHEREQEPADDRQHEPLDDAADRDALAPLRRCPGRRPGRRAAERGEGRVAAALEQPRTGPVDLVLGRCGGVGGFRHGRCMVAGRWPAPV